MNEPADTGAEDLGSGAVDWDASTYHRVADNQEEWGLEVLDRLDLTATRRCSMPAAAPAG